MLPLIPALILLLLSPATAERLAREGRFPAPLTTMALRGNPVASVIAVQAALIVDRRSSIAFKIGASKKPRRETSRVTINDQRSTIAPLRKPSRDRDGPLAC